MRRSHRPAEQVAQPIADSAPAHRLAPPAAGILALQRTLGNAGVVNVMRATTYIRAAQNVASAEKDITTAGSAAKIPHGDLPDDLTWWLEGMGAASMTRYNPGQRQYYSPVGFVVELEDDSQVHGSYAGDGNTSTLKPNLTEPDDYWQAFEAIREALATDSQTRNAWTKIAGEMATTAITSEATIPELKTKLKELLTDPDQIAIKDHAVQLIEDRVRKALRSHYQNIKRVAHPKVVPPGEAEPLTFVLGSGLDPAGLTKAEQALRNAPGQAIPFGESGEVKYTESKAQMMLSNIKGAYYAVEQGEYPALITASWRQGPSWLKTRWQDADHITSKVPGGSLKKLEAGSLAESGPPHEQREESTVPANVRQVVDFVGCSVEQATAALQKHDGDVEQAIMHLVS